MAMARSTFQPMAARPSVRLAVAKPAVAPASLKDVAASGLVLCITASVMGASPALAYNPVASVAQVEERIIKGEGPGLGSYVQEDVEGAFKPPGKDAVEKAEAKGTDAVKGVIGASGVKTFESGPDTEKPSLDLSPNTFFDRLTEKVEATKEAIQNFTS